MILDQVQGMMHSLHGAETGETGKVIGIDFTDAMIEKARTNAEKLGYHNVEFRKGDIEKMPVTSEYR